MKRRLLFVLGLMPFTQSIPADETGAGPTAVKSSRPALQAVLDVAVKETLERFADGKLRADQLAVTVVNLTEPQRGERASYRGDIQVYPASVIKLFYLVAAHDWLERGKIQDRAELRRAMRDMIVDSANEATHYLVDVLTETTSGPELSDEEMRVWYEKRNVVNRYFEGRGYRNINVNRKPWCEGPYGRERQSVEMHRPNHRNWLTTDATARLLTEIVTGEAVSASRSQEMMELLYRDLGKNSSPDGQARGFTGAGLPEGAKLWSKAGWTSQTRHDAAYVELPHGDKFVLVIFTEDHANNREIIPTIARGVIRGLTESR